MAKFYVGQRVRLVRAVGPKNMGIVGTIVEFGEWPTGTPTADEPTWMPCDCKVLYDKYFPSNSFEHTSRLEPATDSYDKIEWSECLWKPEHLREKA